MALETSGQPHMSSASFDQDGGEVLLRYRSQRVNMFEKYRIPLYRLACGASVATGVQLETMPAPIFCSTCS